MKNSQHHLGMFSYFTNQKHTDKVVPRSRVTSVPIETSYPNFSTPPHNNLYSPLQQTNLYSPLQQTNLYSPLQQSNPSLPHSLPHSLPYVTQHPFPQQFHTQSSFPQQHTYNHQPIRALPAQYISSFPQNVYNQSLPLSFDYQSPNIPTTQHFVQSPPIQNNQSYFPDHTQSKRFVPTTQNVRQTNVSIPCNCCEKNKEPDKTVYYSVTNNNDSKAPSIKNGTEFVTQPNNKQPIQHNVVHYISFSPFQPTENQTVQTHNVVHYIGELFQLVAKGIEQFGFKVETGNQQNNIPCNAIATTTSAPVKVVAPVLNNQNTDQKKQELRISSDVAVIPPDTEYIIDSIDFESIGSPQTPSGTNYSQNSASRFSFRYPTVYSIASSRDSPVTQQQTQVPEIDKSLPYDRNVNINT